MPPAPVSAHTLGGQACQGTNGACIHGYVNLINTGAEHGGLSSLWQKALVTDAVGRRFFYAPKHACCIPCSVSFAV